MNTFKKTFAILLSVIAIAVFFIVLKGAVFSSSANDTSIQTVRDAQVSTNPPVHIRIPAIGVDTTVQTTGITQSGHIAVPTNYTDVGWYKYGTLPGNKGSAVMAGHVDDGLALPGVFKNLYKLKKGDDIYITMKNGEVAHYVMKGSETYSKDASTENIFSEKDNYYLKLITCTGTWLSDEGTHSERLVVTGILK
jgi:sortase A